MRLLPKFLRRRNEAMPYTDTVISRAVTTASAGAPSSVEIAAAEIAAGLYARAFASARVAGASDVVAAAIDPATLALVGRQLVLAGEALFEIVTMNGRIELMPASSWTVTGERQPSDWLYQVEFNGPSVSIQRALPASRVMHIRYAYSPLKPWSGRSPLDGQPATARLAAYLEQRLGDEAAAETGRVIPVPDPESLGSELVDSLRAMAGRTMLVPSTATGWGEGAAGMPSRDWYVQRVGSDPPQPLVTLRQQTVEHVLAACGVPADLVQASTESGQREGWRRFLFGTILPVSKLVAAELAAKLDAPDLILEFEELRASDLAGRARAFQSMVGGGMAVAEAAALAGLMIEE